MKIGFLAIADPEDKAVLSGTVYQLYKNIKSIKGVKVIWIPFRIDRSLYSRLYRSYIKRKAKQAGKHYSAPEHLVPIAKRTAKSVDQNLLNQVDILFAPVSSPGFAYLKTDKPIIYLTDATFNLVYGYYDDWKNFTETNIRQGNEIEQRSLDKAKKIITSSDWARNSMINDYHISGDKIKVMEFGANIDSISSNTNKTFEDKKKLNMLFLGAYWERKGGDIAVECAKALNEMGVKTTLTVVGADTPPRYKDLEFINSIGFLNKNIPEEYERLKSIINNNDILLLPTRAEGAGIVFCEASGYGLPIFTTDTGGIPNYVINGENGYRLPLSANGHDFAEKIKECMDSNELSKLSEGGLELYKERLNWNVWTEKFKILLEPYSK